MSKKPTVLMILDGFGLNDKTEGNAVAQAKKPNIDALRGRTLKYGRRQNCIPGADTHYQRDQ